MFGWALPRRPGGEPPTKAFCAWLTSAASVDPRSDTSIRWPRSARRPGPPPAVRPPGDRHQPRLRLDDEVVARARGIRAVPAVSGDRDVDEIRVVGREDVV